MAGYDLSDHAEIINPGDGSALDADLYGAHERREPWLGYQWGANDPALLLDLVRLEEPPYSDECWATTRACAYEDATILIAANQDLSESRPDVDEMLRNWDFPEHLPPVTAGWRDTVAHHSVHTASEAAPPDPGGIPEKVNINAEIHPSRCRGNVGKATRAAGVL